MSPSPGPARVNPELHRHATMLRTDSGEPSRAAPGSSALPSDLLHQSASRLRTVALLYAFIFFMAGFLPAILVGTERPGTFGQWITWVPGAVAIAGSLLVAAAAGNRRVPPSRLVTIGLLFEVVSSYGIAAAEFLGPSSLEPQTHWIGLSWVAVWIVSFTVVVPARPARAVTAALAAASAVPVMVALEVSLYAGRFRPTPLQYFFGLVFPYLLVVLMAYVAARVVYALGTEVRRARELGSYRLVKRLGEGGMGEVWRAEHRMLARPAAIKLIRPALVDATRPDLAGDARHRFEREANAIASLRSPHTVELFDFGVTDDGSFYYVMELLEGLDADALVRRFGPMPAERVVHVLRQVCHSLSEAESRGLVHRDIKPANVFLCRLGEDHDFVKVLDFGLVKATHAPDDVGTTHTRDNVVPGTPAFIAPEQVVGGAPVDGRADLYATACVAFWLLTGQLVFEAATPMALLMHHAKTPPEPPSSRSELPIPPALDALILACLAKDPAARPQTARELRARLDAIPGLPEWTEDRAREWWARHRPERTG